MIPPRLAMRLSAPRTWSCLVIAMTTGSLLAGCQRQTLGPTRFPVTGKVTLGGEPVPAGRVMFEPDAAAGNDGPAGVATITDGIYKTEPRFGAVGGPHVVRIDGHSKVDPANPDAVRTLFRDYSTKVDLPRGPTTLDFDVPKKPVAGRPGK